jgi:hypothetical protein
MMENLRSSRIGSDVARCHFVARVIKVGEADVVFVLGHVEGKHASSEGLGHWFIDARLAKSTVKQYEWAIGQIHRLSISKENPEIRTAGKRSSLCFLVAKHEARIVDTQNIDNSVSNFGITIEDVGILELIRKRDQQRSGSFTKDSSSQGPKVVHDAEETSHRQRSVEIDSLRSQLEIEKAKNVELAAKIAELSEDSGVAIRLQQENARLSSENDELKNNLTTAHESIRSSENYAERLAFLLEGRKSGIEDHIVAESEPDEEAPLRIDLHRLGEHAASSNFDITLVDIRRTTLAYLCAMSLGQQVVFVGPPGSGKTTAGTWFPTVFGFSSSVIPVRPGWLDSSDLLGYCDTRQWHFEQGPLIDEVDRALEAQKQRRYHSVVLDEMNIARVENYAAQILSLLEKSHEANGTSDLRLFSEEAERRISESRGKSRSATIRIPRNLIITGTMNHDRSTHALSPKVKDRCLFVRLSPKNVRDRRAGASGPKSTSPVSFSKLSFLADRGSVSSQELDLLWENLSDVLSENQTTDLHISRRFIRAFNLISVFSEVLQEPEGTLVQDLVCLKLLPWIDLDQSLENGGKLDALRGKFEAVGMTEVASEIADLLGQVGRRYTYLE